MALLSHGLLPASFRGVPFAVVATDEQFGRRVALHVYPGRDSPWAEDMGRAPRAFRLRGFIVAEDQVYLGGPIALQRALLTAAAEKGGSGVLTHPTLGVLQVACRGFSLGEDIAAGSISEVTFEFVESGKRSFPSLLSGSGLLSASTLCAAAVAIDVARAVALASNAASPRRARAAAAGLADVVERKGQDATALARSTSRLGGNLGRYAGGANAGVDGPAATVAMLVADASTQRAAIAAAAAGFVAASSEADGARIADASAALVDALLAACADPADAVRLLIALAAVRPTGESSPIVLTVSAAVRRSTAVALARAVAAYRPSSYDDAAALLVRVAALLDAIAVEAADVGDDGSYAALRAMRAAVVEDLRAKGASLARVKLFAVRASLPALALAQRLYGDATRADALVKEAGPRHPLFMPAAFQALAA